MDDQLAELTKLILESPQDPARSALLTLRLAERAGERLLSLASAQLEAYNQADLDAFCACYASDIQAYRAGALICEGQAALRARYEPLFASKTFGAEVVERSLNPLSGALTDGGVSVSCVDVEDWWREAKGELSSGRVWVQYHLKLHLNDPHRSLISRVEFFDQPLASL